MGYLMALNILLMIIGLVILYFSADWLVSGSARLASRFRIPPLIIGLTIVAFGTSMPELLVSVTAAMRGSSGIALGNIIGSNIANIAFILGVSALIRPLGTKLRTLRLEAPVMVLAALCLLLSSIDSLIGRWDGLLFVFGIILFTIYNYRTGKQESESLPDDIKIEFEKPQQKPIPRISLPLLILIGIGGLVLGAQLLVMSALEIAAIYNISETFIGLTIVALGTSLPELATSTVAAWKGEDDISIGNIVGSNIFNVFAIAGIAAIIHPIELVDGLIDGNYMVDFLLMILLSLTLWYFMYTGKQISRGEGAILLAVYIFYLLYLSLQL
jgi:cation:H+ antiporter